MKVLGRDSAREGYRIRAGGAVALLPDAVISTGMALTGGHGHATAYDWIARHAREIETAIDALARGAPARPSFETMELENATSGAGM